MGELRGTCVVAQSGGPTAVINASILGVIEAAIQSPSITRALGAINGVQGLLEQRLCDLGAEDPRELALLAQTPAAALGSCRYRLREEADFKHLLEIFRAYDVRYFFYNGGNDSMDTCDRISRYMAQVGYECRVIGVPKTIDNDLDLTDHCPGYGSAARYIAASAMEIRRDIQVYNTDSVIILEIMGRHAGWLAGSAALAGTVDQGPDLVYLPEIPFSLEAFLDDVDRVRRASGGKCMVAISEGVQNEAGEFFTGGAMAGMTDSFGHTQLGGLASSLAALVRDKLGVKKVRGIELSLLQRCAAHFASGRDISEARMAGRAAVEAALAGHTGKMVAFRCSRTGGYRCEPTLVELSQVANQEKRVPREWINSAGNGVTSGFLDYLSPLVQGEFSPVLEQGLPRYARLKLAPIQR